MTQQQDNTAGSSSTVLAPPGWVTNHQAARMLGVRLEELTNARWKWRPWLRDSGKCVRLPGARGRGNIYPIEQIQRIIDAREQEARTTVPEGFVTRQEAWAIMGIAPTTWKRWQHAGRLPKGEMIRVPSERGWRKVYSRQSLEQVLEDLKKLGQPYPDPARPGCWRVPVMSFWTVRCEAIIDEQDLPRVEGRRWNWLERGDGVEDVVILAAVEYATLRQIILGLDHSTWRISHANGDPLDCRRSNLVVKSLSETTARARKHRHHAGEPCTSRFKGVSREPDRGKWRVCIKKGNLFRFIGRFGDEIAAAEAYDEAAKELFGEHARLNFPNGIDARLAHQTAEMDAASKREAA